MELEGRGGGLQLINFGALEQNSLVIKLLNYSKGLYVNFAKFHVMRDWYGGP